MKRSRVTYETQGGSDGSPDIVYVNLQVSNVNAIDSGPTPVVEYTEPRSSAIIKDPSSYYGSIVRFTTDAGRGTPLFMPIMQTYQNNGTVFVPSTANQFLLTFVAGTGNININMTVGSYTPTTFLAMLNPIMATAILSTTVSAAVASWTSVTEPGTLVIRITTTSPQIGLAMPTTAVQDLLGFPALTQSAGSPVTFVGANPITWTPATTYDTIYSLTLTGQIGSSPIITPIQTWIQWFPEFASAPKPQLQPGGLLVQKPADKYWWCTSYQHWVACVNAAFATMWTDPQIVSASVTTLCPKMTYSPSTGLFSIAYDSNGFGNNASTWLNSVTGVRGSAPVVSAYDGFGAGDQGLRWSNPAECFTLMWNGAFQSLFANFNVVRIGNELSYGRDYLAIVTPTTVGAWDPWTINGATGTVADVQRSSVVTPARYPAQLFIETQDYISTCAQWCPVSALVFSSASMPFIQEFTSPANLLSTGNNSSTQGSNNTSFPIITDISLDLDRAEGYRGFVSYVPAVYRLADLGSGTLPIQTINMKVYWRDRLTGELVEYELPNGSAITMKIMFRRKGSGQ